MAMKIFVGNLGYSVDNAALERLFAKHGRVESAAVVTDRSTGESRGFGFVEMSNSAEGHAAIKALSGAEHDGRALTVNPAKPREDRAGSGGWNRL
jgi:cold-inducible RNA-binding protein